MIGGIAAFTSLAIRYDISIWNGAFVASHLNEHILCAEWNFHFYFHVFHVQNEINVTQRR